MYKKSHWVLVAVFLLNFFPLPFAFSEGETDCGTSMQVESLVTADEPAKLRFLQRYLLLPFGRAIAWNAFKLRYNISYTGLDQIKAKPGGILFLPNHPGYVDPMIQWSILSRKFDVRPVMDVNQAKNSRLVDRVTRLIRPIYVPDAKDQNQDSVGRLAEVISNALDRGENVLLYNEGRLTRGRPIPKGSLLSRVLALRKAKPPRIVLSQTIGLGGSSFGTAHTGDSPPMFEVLGKRVVDLLANGVFWMPKVDVNIRYEEIFDFPFEGTVQDHNKVLADFFDTGMPNNLWTPYQRGSKYKPVKLPYPLVPEEVVTGKLEDVGADIQQRALALLEDFTDVRPILPEQDLFSDHGLDSVDVMDAVASIEKEFNVRGGPVKTVRELMLIAAGFPTSMGVQLRSPDGRWMNHIHYSTAELKWKSDAKNIFETLRYKMAHNADDIVLSDNLSGGLSYRDLAVALKLFIPLAKKIPGKYVGILLPCSVADVIMTWAVMMVGKVPVMINPTAKDAGVARTVSDLGIQRIITSERYLERLDKVKGLPLPSVRERMVTMEEMRESIPKSKALMTMLWSKKRGYFQGFDWPEASSDDLTVILCTSGSTGQPKYVPYTHGMEMANSRDLSNRVALNGRDRFLIIAPPFHSLGQRAKMLALMMGIPHFFSPDPMDKYMLAAVSRMYQPTLFAGTPDFVTGMLAGGGPADFTSYRLFFMGADKVTKAHVDKIKEKVPDAKYKQGLGLTETSPALFVADDASPWNSIGKPVESAEVLLIPIEQFLEIKNGMILKDVGPKQKGVLLTRNKPGYIGPVMAGYLNKDIEQPFVTDSQGRRWYMTGDVLSYDETGDYYFHERIQRIGKKNGEMIPLDGMESRLLEDPLFAVQESDIGPMVDVEEIILPTGPDYVLFTTRDVTALQVNKILDNSILPRVARIGYVVRVPILPLLGTGKIDRKPQKQMIKDWEAGEAPEGLVK